MNTHLILQTVQYITVGMLFAEMVIVFLKWKNSIHSYLFLACVASFLSNLGYLFELGAQSEEAYLSAIKFSYVGRTFIVFAFFLFSARMCSIKLPRGIVYALLLIHTGIYISVLTIGSNSLYYKEYSFVPDPDFPKFYHTNGSIHDVFMMLNVILMLMGIVWLVREYRRERNKRSRQRVFMVMLAFGVQMFAFFLQMTGLIPFSEFYDLTMPGTLIGTVFMLVGILGFDLLGTREIAKDFAIDRISEGIIAVDHDGRIKYYNEPAAKIYPQFRNFYSSILPSRVRLLKKNCFRRAQ